MCQRRTNSFLPDVARPGLSHALRRPTDATVGVRGPVFDSFQSSTVI